MNSKDQRAIAFIIDSVDLIQGRKALCNNIQKICTNPIDHFTVVRLVTWPLNESEAGVDLVLIETLLLFICKFLLISMRTASLT